MAGTATGSADLRIGTAKKPIENIGAPSGAPLSKNDRSILLTDYPQRARYRDGFDKQHLLTPGEPAKLAWHIGFTSIIFNKGHRIRVTIASTGVPFYEPNNQTGGAQTIDWMKTTQPAINTIWHDAARPSRLIAPVMKGVR